MVRPVKSLTSRRPRYCRSERQRCQVRNPMAIVNRSKGLRKAIAKQGKLLAELGGSITVQQQET